MYDLDTEKRIPFDRDKKRGCRDAEYVFPAIPFKMSQSLRSLFLPFPSSSPLSSFSSNESRATAKAFTAESCQGKKKKTKPIARDNHGVVARRTELTKGLEWGVDSVR